MPKEIPMYFPFYNSIVCIIIRLNKILYFVCPSTQQNKFLAVILQWPHKNIPIGSSRTLENLYKDKHVCKNIRDNTYETYFSTCFNNNFTYIILQ